MMHSNEDSSGKLFPTTIDLDAERVDVSELHAQVLRRNGRVELRRGGESCVLLTRQELESLEEALQILSDSDAVRAVRDQIAFAAHLASPMLAEAFPVSNRSIHLP